MITEVFHIKIWLNLYLVWVLCLASAHVNLSGISFYVTHITWCMESKEIKSKMYYFRNCLEILDTHLGCKWIWYDWLLRDIDNYTYYHWFWRLYKSLTMTDFIHMKIPVRVQLSFFLCCLKCTLFSLTTTKKSLCLIRATNWFFRNFYTVMYLKNDDRIQDHPLRFFLFHMLTLNHSNMKNRITEWWTMLDPESGW